ncbi:S8 family peptidase [Methylobacterium platani]|uniref:Peptidase S8/S53 domain-containing protein n=2 Tax=Methylobacterium platani TaxID=427683 RepID=A0A179SDX5_9HYPH|nr:S8 family serine peptidase [Methylobacterium platani]KMO15236.1 hypothetical protein SQ03_17610 [Methylobacterium platani JCM 14648]OAS26054.1 hypothetical protein A5481_06765 [Methylobacterium platani]
MIAMTALAAPEAPYTVVAASRDDGPTLLEMSPQAARRLRESVPSVLVEKDRRISAAVRTATRLRMHRDWTVGASDGKRVRVKVTDPDGRPVPGARILVFADVAQREGVARRTRPSGVASLVVPARTGSFPRIVVEPPAGYRSLDAGAVAASAEGDIALTLAPVDPRGRDGTSALRGEAGTLTGLDVGRGVRIAVVDTGVDPRHPDLAHVATRNVYQFDADPAVAPHPHANHVAGLIGARGRDFRGMAPGATLFSYRFTPLGLKDGALFDLGEAIRRTGDDDVHLINISMASRSPSQFLGKAAVAAFQRGAICIAAAGNDGRDSISFPAAAKRYYAVTAYGDRSVLTDGVRELEDLSDVTSSVNAAMSRARFSNWGADTDFIGPGVGLISCAGAAGYAIDSGTSFAAPVIVGLAAAILAEDHPDILAMPPDMKRATAIAQVLTERCRDLGFAFETQGSGILHVADEA